ncbi:MAG: hypothetical protein PHR82_07815 [Endomicrobiaceae bacterium]|jgi:hypothetical protein|nr:hypothetical protein [Endomicrobiaceae bacterium]
MIVETTIYYSQKDIAKRCWGCKHLKMEDDFSGVCECHENKVKIRDRYITSKACRFKEDSRRDKNGG